MTEGIDSASAPDEATEKLLLNHPRVRAVSQDETGTFAFHLDGWKREIVRGYSVNHPSGLIELIDNNPVVCADRIGLPSPAGTLALVAIGPIAQAGLLIEAPTMLTNAPGDELEVTADLASADWHQGITLETQELDLGSVYAATVIAAIRTPESLDEIDDLYDERFSRSFFIRRDETSPWDINLVQSRPHLVYRLRIAPDTAMSLLTIQVMSDRDGKCGAAQFIHAMNVMCGYEESLGIA